jgi:ribosomal protein S4E
MLDWDTAAASRRIDCIRICCCYCSCCCPPIPTLHRSRCLQAPRPSTGPHKLRECLPLSLILRNRLRYALTRREVLQIVMRKSVQIDGQVRTDIQYPAGFQDVISLPKTSEQFRLLYDVKASTHADRTGGRATRDI